MAAPNGYTDRSSSDPRGRMRLGVARSPSPARGDALAAGGRLLGRLRGDGTYALHRPTIGAGRPASAGADEKAASEVGDNMRAVSAIGIKDA